VKIIRRRLAGVVEIELDPRSDPRGYFMRVFDADVFAAHNLPTRWVQGNESLSIPRNVIRGLHYQRPPHTEAKLVRAASGAVLDVFVDLRLGSPTFGQWDKVTLSAERHNMVLVPRGFAHGFCTLTENSTVIYMVDNAYAPTAEGGVRWDDPAIGIEWPLTAEPIISDKDRAWPGLAETAPIPVETIPTPWSGAEDGNR